MERRCPECKEGRLEATGIGTYGDTIEVECSKCGHFDELEPDGLGEGGLEWLQAVVIDFKLYMD